MWYGKGNVIHGTEHAPLGIERGDEVIHFQQITFAQCSSSFFSGSGVGVCWAGFASPGGVVGKR